MNPQGSASLLRAGRLAECRSGAAMHAAGAASEEARLRRLRVLVMAQFVFKGRVGGAEHVLYNLLGSMGGACAELGVLCASERNLDPQVVRQLRRMPGVSVAECGAGREEDCHRGRPQDPGRRLPHATARRRFR